MSCYFSWQLQSTTFDIINLNRIVTVQQCIEAGSHSLSLGLILHRSAGTQEEKWYFVEQFVVFQ